MSHTSEVFISYRSDDTGEAASRLHEALEAHLGPGRVFLDQARLSGGTVWPDTLRAAVADAQVVLALIGPRWLTVQDAKTGDRRLNLPEDWVRLELEGALAANRTIVPVLVADARYLEASDLRTVPSLAPLANLQPMRLRRQDWRTDVTSLLERLDALGVSSADAARVSDSRPHARDGAASPSSRTRQPLIAAWPEPAATTDTSATRSFRVKVAGAAAMVVLLAGGAAWWRHEPNRTADAPGSAPGSPPAHTSATTPPAASPTTPSPPPTVEVTLSGAVQIPAQWADTYASERDNFRIEARAGRPKTTLGGSPLDAAGAFRLAVTVPADAGTAPELAWTWTHPGRWVLWPVVQEHATSPFDGYTFTRLDDAFDSRKGSILRDISRGQFDGANSQWLELSNVFEMFDDPAQAAIPGYAAGELSFKLLQQMCTKAHDYRSTSGRSRVSEEMIDIEREWRKRQFSAARSAGAPVPTLARALNSWGDFSREVYSRQQRRWPDRSLSEAADSPFVETHLATMLVEDLNAVLGELRWMKGALQARGAWNGLAPGNQRAYDRIIDSDADAVSLSGLANLLTALAAMTS